VSKFKKLCIRLYVGLGLEPFLGLMTRVFSLFRLLKCLWSRRVLSEERAGLSAAKSVLVIAIM
jgi:hypothetical protein